MAVFYKYPDAPPDLPPKAQKSWNDLVRILVLKDQQSLSLFGTRYTVSGTVTVECTLDLGSITLTATTQALAKLLKDMSTGRALKVVLIP